MRGGGQGATKRGIVKNRARGGRPLTGSFSWAPPRLPHPHLPGEATTCSVCLTLQFTRAWGPVRAGGFRVSISMSYTSPVGRLWRQRG